jgi:hypothetical protein
MRDRSTLALSAALVVLLFAAPLLPAWLRSL